LVARHFHSQVNSALEVYELILFLNQAGRFRLKPIKILALHRALLAKGAMVGLSGHANPASLWCLIGQGSSRVRDGRKEGSPANGDIKRRGNRKRRNRDGWRTIMMHELFEVAR
jgi:hypothetical protein